MIKKLLSFTSLYSVTSSFSSSSRLNVYLCINVLIKIWALIKRIFVLLNIKICWVQNPLFVLYFDYLRVVFERIFVVNNFDELFAWNLQLNSFSLFFFKYWYPFSTNTWSLQYGLSFYCSNPFNKHPNTTPSVLFSITLLHSRQS